MLDVLHYLMDEDMSFVSSDEAKLRSSVREVIYGSIYNTKYKYSISDDNNSYADFDDDSLISTGNAKSTQVKPYMPPTPFNPDAPNPFGAALRERPLG